MNNHIRYWFVLLKCSSFLGGNELSIFMISDATSLTTALYQVAHSHPSPGLVFNILFAFTGFFFSVLGQRADKWKNNPVAIPKQKETRMFFLSPSFALFLYNSILFWAVYEVLTMQSCLVPGQPPATERWLTGQSVGTAQLGTHFMHRADTKREGEVLTDSSSLLTFKSTEELFTKKIKSNLISRRIRERKVQGHSRRRNA